MSTTTPGTARTEIPTPQPRKPRKALKVGLGVMTVGLALAIGIGVGASGNHATMASAAKPAATTPAAPAPATSAPAAPSTPAEQAPKQSTYNAPIGSTLTLTDDSDGSKWTVTVNSVKLFHQGEYDDPAGPGYHYISADISYDAIAGKVSPGSYDWTAKDATGQTYDTAYVSADSDLKSNDIQAGQKARGTVEFKVPDSKDVTLVYSSGMSEQASWTVPHGL